MPAPSNPDAPHVTDFVGRACLALRPLVPDERRARATARKIHAHMGDFAAWRFREGPTFFDFERMVAAMVGRGLVGLPEPDGPAPTATARALAYMVRNPHLMTLSPENLALREAYAPRTGDRSSKHVLRWSRGRIERALEEAAGGPESHGCPRGARLGACAPEKVAYNQRPVRGAEKPFEEASLREEGEGGRPMSARREKMPLKNGAGRMEVVGVRYWEAAVRELLETAPERFRALRAVVEGRPNEADRRRRRELVKTGFISPDGSPNSIVKAVLTAALRDTPDGPVIVDPFDVGRPEDADTLRRADEEQAAIRRQADGRLWRRIAREIERRRNGEDGGRGL